MIQIAVPVPMQNGTRIRCLSWCPNDETNEGWVLLRVMGPAASARQKDFCLTIRNGSCDRLGLLSNPGTTPGSWDSMFVVDQINVATGFDQLEAAFSGASRAARFRGLETALQNMGVVAAALQGNVT